ncbi:MAG: RNA-binding transcriptional accessory protein [Clostridiales bacterium]|nr:RNA-binding transcriptional accessory protein [Clostridiales bacterium]
MEIKDLLAQEFGLKQEYSQNIINLLDEGCTIPFIARYRKEMHGTCDDQTLRAFADRLKYLRNLNEEKAKVEKTITEQGKWTDELAVALANAMTLTEVEDIYRPYKPKRKTRASVAIARGLEPLADILQMQSSAYKIEQEAEKFITEEVATVKDAIAGAKDIIAERISDSADLRKALRKLLEDKATIECALQENENSATYETYANFKQEIKNIPSHRILAINRGEKEKCLKVDIIVNRELALGFINKEFKKNNEDTDALMAETIEDAYDRLLFPSLERECRNDLTDRADEQAIKMFELNLKPLLMEAPLKNNIILGLDPAYRTGCKIAVIDVNGNVLDTTVIYPTPPQSKTEESIEKLKKLIEKYRVDIVSIGNGTASKEAEIFVAELIKHVSRPVSYAVVSEAGASVYSASKLGAEEFPDYDVSLRSAVSIARRLQDPLAELIKIDVKSIGVGQYQHDMPQNRLTEVLTGVVEDCVNSVGVDLNTASPSLLSYVSGLNMSIAKNIVAYRAKAKGIKNREELLEVSKLGPKAYEQCAGFLRVVDGNNILDNTGVHPESYGATKKLLALFNLTEEDVKNGNISNLPQLIALKGEENVARECEVGVPTLNDIVKELLKPGRDIRESMPKPVLRSDVITMEDLKEGMIFSGVVRNVIDFGAFVDIGVHQDGLVHISQISDAFVKHPSELLKVGQRVDVKILSVDLNKKRISLTMKGIEKE